MEATKKVTGKSVKKWLGNNAIIVLMLAVSLIVGIIHPNFFALANIINLFKNVSIRYIIALGISGCLITTGNDLSAGVHILITVRCLLTNHIHVPLQYDWLHILISF